MAHTKHLLTIEISPLHHTLPHELHVSEEYYWTAISALLTLDLPLSMMNIILQ